MSVSISSLHVHPLDFAFGKKMHFHKKMKSYLFGIKLSLLCKTTNMLTRSSGFHFSLREKLYINIEPQIPQISWVCCMILLTRLKPFKSMLLRSLALHSLVFIIVQVNILISKKVSLNP